MSQHRVVVTTLGPARPGLTVKVLLQSDESVLLEGVTDKSGAWRVEHDLDSSLLVVLLLLDGDTELIRCHVPLHALNPMECLMRLPPKRTEKEMHKLWKKKIREQQAAGVASPDPEAVARQAFKY